MAHWGVALPFRSGVETPYHHLDRLRTSVWRDKETRVRDAPGSQPGRAANFVEVQAKFAEPSFHLLQKVMRL
jgi:hypothetical protein